MPDTNHCEMTAEDVTRLYSALEELGIRIWIDGGWAVDALLGAQTRPHADLDIALQKKDIEAFAGCLAFLGYREKIVPEDKKWTTVYEDDSGRSVDVHAFSFDEKGKIVERDEYPEGSLSGSGSIAGLSVRCVAPEDLVRFHLRHEPREKDFKDVDALCKKFRLKVPEEYS